MLWDCRQRPIKFRATTSPVSRKFYEETKLSLVHVEWSTSGKWDMQRLNVVCNTTPIIYNLLFHLQCLLNSFKIYAVVRVENRKIEGLQLASCFSAF
jgi:hypothetical protein